MKFLKLYESYSRGKIVTKGVFMPAIGYEKDFEENKINLMNNYFTGTAIIGPNEIFPGVEDTEEPGVTDYSSPFHKGQVISNETYDDWEEEVDFTYHRSISENYIKKELDKYVQDNYENSKIKHFYFH